MKLSIFKTMCMAIFLMAISITAFADVDSDKAELKAINDQKPGMHYRIDKDDELAKTDSDTEDSRELSVQGKAIPQSNVA